MNTTRCRWHRSKHDCRRGQCASRDRAIGNAVVLLLMFAVRLHVSEAEKRFVPEMQCTSPVISIPCSDSLVPVVRFYFDINTANCSTFDYYPDCPSSENNFLTWNLCASSCIETIVQPSPVIPTSLDHSQTIGPVPIMSVFVVSSSYMNQPLSLFPLPTTWMDVTIPSIKATTSSVINSLSMEFSSNPISSVDSLNYATSNTLTYDAVSIGLGFVVLLVCVVLLILVVLFVSRHKVRMLSQQLSDSYNSKCGNARNYDGKTEPPV